MAGQSNQATTSDVGIVEVAVGAIVGTRRATETPRRPRRDPGMER